MRKQLKIPWKIAQPKTREKRAADHFDEEKKQLKILAKKLFINDNMAAKKEAVNLHRERTQPPVDDARDGPTGRPAERPEGRWPRFSVVP